MVEAVAVPKDNTRHEHEKPEPLERENSSGIHREGGEEETIEDRLAWKRKRNQIGDRGKRVCSES